MKTKIFITSLGLLAALISACNAADVVDNTVDCQTICKRYSDCFDANYDVAACRDRCMDKSNADPNFMKQVEMCDTCITDQDCTAATFKCATECAQIVP